MAIDAGCPKDRAERFAALAESAVIETLKACSSNRRLPTRNGTVKHIERLRDDLKAFGSGSDGEMALAIMKTIPTWRALTIEQRIEELEHARRVAIRTMRG